MATNVRKTLLSVQIFICVMDLTKGRFQNFMPMKSARKYVFFSDISLTHSFFKANLICNACNGYLVSQNVTCSSHPEAKFFSCPDANFVQDSLRPWRSTYFQRMVAEQNIQSRLILTDNTLNNSTGVPSVKLRNPLFFISTPCMVQSEEATNMEQRPCEQKRFFTCQYATFTATAFGNLTGLAVCVLKDICTTSVENPVAKIGCPYIVQFNSQQQYQNSRIIHGTKNLIMMHPWIVRVYVNMEKGLGRCGGSIVTSKYVITAKHCFGIDLKFTGGRVEYSAPPPLDTQHSEFSTNDVILFADCDAAIIKLKDIIVFSTYAMPVKLPGPLDSPSLRTWSRVSGWGSFCPPSEPFCSQNGTYSYSSQLLSVNVQHLQCQELKQEIPQNTQCYEHGYLCLGGFQIYGGVAKSELMKLTQVKDPIKLSNHSIMFPADGCVGDSGGPLECFNEQGETYLCGIVSFGPEPPHCGRFPGRYTSVTHPRFREFFAQIPDRPLQVRTDWLAKMRGPETKSDGSNATYEILFSEKLAILYFLVKMVLESRYLDDAEMITF